MQIGSTSTPHANATGSVTSTSGSDKQRHLLSVTGLEWVPKSPSTARYAIASLTSPGTHRLHYTAIRPVCIKRITPPSRLTPPASLYNWLGSDQDCNQAKERIAEVLKAVRVAIPPEQRNTGWTRLTSPTGDFSRRLLALTSTTGGRLLLNTLMNHLARLPEQGPKEAAHVKELATLLEYSDTTNQRAIAAIHVDICKYIQGVLPHDSSIVEDIVAHYTGQQFEEFFDAMVRRQDLEPDCFSLDQRTLIKQGLMEMIGCHPNHDVSTGEFAFAPPYCDHLKRFSLHTTVKSINEFYKTFQTEATPLIVFLNALLHDWNQSPVGQISEAASNHPATQWLARVLDSPIGSDSANQTQSTARGTERDQALLRRPSTLTVLATQDVIFALQSDDPIQHARAIFSLDLLASPLQGSSMGDVLFVLNQLMESTHDTPTAWITAAEAIITGWKQKAIEHGDSSSADRTDRLQSTLKDVRNENDADLQQLLRVFTGCHETPKPLAMTLLRQNASLVTFQSLLGGNTTPINELSLSSEDVHRLSTNREANLVLNYLNSTVTKNIKWTGNYASLFPKLSYCQCDPSPFFYELARIGIDFNEPTPEGWTPLTLACQNGDRTTTSALIEAGADIELRSPQGRSPLEIAVDQNDGPLTSLLLDKGADPNTINPIDGNPLLIAAILDQHTHAAKVLIDHDHIEIDKMTTHDHPGKTALMIATEQNDETLARWLIEAGAEDQLDECMECARANGNFAMLRCLDS